MMRWRNVAVLFSVLAVSVTLAGCAGESDRRHGVNSAVGTGERIAAISQRLVGSPYRSGGESPAGFDCSGLVRYVYRQVGIEVPRSSRLQYRRAQKVPLDRLRPGDLLFFRMSVRKVSHVGIYASDSTFVHAPSRGKSVTIARLDNPYWESRLLAAGRFH